MNPGNLIIHLPLQARNLAVTLESDLSLSHPTRSPLPNSVESSPKYLLHVTPPLHCRSLCPGSDPQDLSFLNHYQCVCASGRLTRLLSAAWRRLSDGSKP